MNKQIKACGFTLTEVIISMLIMLIIIVITLPLMTGRKLAVGTDKLAQKCILEDAGSTASSSCVSAISNCKINNSNNSCNNLSYYADKGTTTQKNSALKVLQEACNQGGVLACNYLINICMINNTMCNITSTTPATGLRPFLLKNNFDNTFGKLVIEKTLKDYYTDSVKNIMDEVDTDCCTGSVLNAACNIKNIFTCTTPGPPDPACGFTPSTTTIVTTSGTIKVSNCNNVSSNLVANGANPGVAGCWTGAGTAGSNCTNTDNPYPGCGRPLCNHAGAVNACSKLNGGTDYGSRNWRLPTKDEMANWGANKVSLSLCDMFNSYSPYCNSYSGCSGGSSTLCHPYDIWSADSAAGDYYYYALGNGGWDLMTNDLNWSLSVRCVRSL